MPRPLFLKGRILLPDRVVDGHVELQHGEVVAVTEGSPPGNGQVAAKGIVLPRLFNSHVHMGDSFLHPAPKMSVEELVGPPDGYKHRRLREAAPGEVVQGMVRALDDVLNSGGSGFLDFREGGLAGVRLGQDAAGSYPMNAMLGCATLGRPSGLCFDPEEAEGILEAARGMGLSAFSDWPAGELEKLAGLVRSSGGFLALHASEHAREPMEEILKLGPDMLVHLVEATPSDLEMVRDAGVPVAICARSNAFFGLKRDFKALLDSGVALLGGTDNTMITRPQCLEEMRFLLEASREAGAPLAPRTVLEMFTANPAKALNDTNLIARPGGSGTADLMVLRTGPDAPGRTHDPYGVLNYLSSDDIICILNRDAIYYPGMRLEP